MNPLPSVRPGDSQLPVVVVDTREQTPLPITRLPCMRAALRSGDYSFAGAEEHFAVERKSIEDLIGCCAGENRERFERELHRLRGFHFSRLLVIGSRDQILGHEYRSRIKPASVLGSLHAWEVRYGVPVVFIPTPEEAARMVEAWVWWSARELVLCTNRLRRCAAPDQQQARGSAITSANNQP